MERKSKKQDGNQRQPQGQQHKNERRQQYQPGAPNSSNRLSKGHEKGESSGASKNTTKKQGNSI